jgi:cytochrome c-type biogenesis protein CcmF
MTLAHAGLAVAIMGFVGSTAWKEEVVVFAEPGTEIEVAGFDLRFEGVEEVRGPNYLSSIGALAVSRDGRPVAVLRPERRRYPVAGSTTTEAAIRSTPAGDLFASIGEPAAEDAAGKWTLRVASQPLVGFIWFGVAMMVSGGLVSLSDRRLRVGAPRRRPVVPGLATPAE